MAHGLVVFINSIAQGRTTCAKIFFQDTIGLSAAYLGKITLVISFLTHFLFATRDTSG